MKLRCMIGMICGLALCGWLAIFGAGADGTILLGDVPVTDANAADVLGDGTVRYLPPDGEQPARLCLYGAETESLTVCGGPLTLELTGENRIDGGLWVGCPLTVCGAGSLTVTGGVTLAPGGEILLPTAVRVCAGNSENGLDAVPVETPDADVYRSPYVRFETAFRTVRYLPDETCGGAPVEGKKYVDIPLILPGALFSRTGYTQSGWRCADGSVTYALGESVRRVSDPTFYPVWTVNLYTMTFRLGNGEQDMVRTLAYGAPFQTPPAPVRIGYRFCGWDRPIPGTVPATDLTFAALWEICDHSGNTAQRSCSAETVCSECGETLEKLPHTPAEDDGDCTTPIFCQVCGATVRIGSGGHRLGSWQTGPDGERYRVCRNDDCGYRETERSPQSGDSEPDPWEDEEPDRMPSDLWTGFGDDATSGGTKALTTPPERADTQEPGRGRNDGCNSALSCDAVLSALLVCFFMCLRKRKR